MTTEEFKERVFEKYGDEVEILSKYNGGTSPIDFVYHCEKHGDTYKTINAKNILAKSFSPCKECTKKQRSKKAKNPLRFDKEYQYNRLVQYVESKGGKLISKEWTRAKDLYEIDCNNPDHPNFFNNADKIMNSKQWCPYCCGRKGDFEEEIREIIHSKNGELLSEYINSQTHVQVKCNKHNYIWDIMPFNIKKGRWCPVCNLTESEKITYDFLMNNKIKFDIQHTFDDLVGRNNEKLRFDFAIYINNTLILLEIDGDEHRSRGESSYSRTVRRNDKLKNKYCSNKNIQLIRIPYYNGKNPTYEEFYEVIDKVLTEKIINKYNIAI